MGIGAVEYNINNYQFNTGLNKNYGEDSFSDFLTLGTATRETTSSNNGKTIGITTVGSNGYLAKYADSSTPAEPVIKVGNYEVHINEVNPNNATELEMFALMSYTEDTGMVEKQGMSSFSKMKAYSLQSEFNGNCSGIYDEQSFWDKKQNWNEIIENAKQTFANIPETYKQSLNCGKLLSYFEKWISEKFN